ncbi:MAG: CRISPR-associated endonuclease Cas2 [Ruminococcaceae bacterium]|nr:CRISPR-associated endonuclease Cas2 [Oscillospiraceae bacterium]
MYIILTYDIATVKISKVRKVCKKYLRHIQKSVFEGSLTCSQLKLLKKELKPLISPQTDSIIIYEFENLKFTSKEQLGVSNEYTNVI